MIVPKDTIILICEANDNKLMFYFNDIEISWKLLMRNEHPKIVSYYVLYYNFYCTKHQRITGYFDQK